MLQLLQDASLKCMPGVVLHNPPGHLQWSRQALPSSLGTHGLIVLGTHARALQTLQTADSSQ